MMRKKFSTKDLLRILPLALLVVVTAGFFFVTPEIILQHVGTENAYLFMFAIAFLGGMATFGSVPYSLVLVSLAAAGLHPLLVGAIAAFGVTFGDTVTYFLGYQGHSLAREYMPRVIEWLRAFQSRHPRLTPAIIFCYGAFVPLSNDVVTIPLGLSRYPYWRTMLALVFGTAIFNIGLAYATVYAYPYLQMLL